MEITTDMSQRASFDHDIPRAGKHCGQIGEGQEGDGSERLSQRDHCPGEHQENDGHLISPDSICHVKTL